MYKEKTKKQKIIALIPARGGSKGIPGKNIKFLAGKPLIAYTIEVAKKCRYLDKIFVSTDDEEIAKISRKYGAEIIKRPNILAGDKSKFIDAIFYHLEKFKKENFIPEVLVVLQPTSPLRTTNDIKEAIELFLNNECESVVSVSEPEHSLQWSFQKKGKYLKPIFGWKYFKGINRQDVEKTYLPNGAIFISRPKFLYLNKSFYSKKTLPYFMPKDRSVDIDNMTDFLIAESAIKNN
jgi:CMP-N,N'-diacetyllegionaminic acid synthase